jgi:hypothetical protein
VKRSTNQHITARLHRIVMRFGAARRVVLSRLMKTSGLAVVIVLVCAALLMASGTMPPTAVATAVRMEHYEDHTATLTLAVDGRDTCRIALTAQKTYQVRDVCSFELPPTARDIQISGEYAFTRSRKREHVRGSRRFQIVDLAPVVSPLRDASRPFGQRVRAFVSATKTLTQSYPAFKHALEVEPGTSETAEAVAAAQSRLGFALPPEHVSLLREIDGLRINDSFMMRARYVNRAYQQMIDVWGSSAASLNEALDPSTLALLKASTILYTEVGDGYGALLYEPAVPGRPSACGQQPAFHWLHQDDINEPKVLRRAAGKTCRAYEDTMLWLFMTQALSRLEDEDQSLALIDRSTPSTLRLQLFFRPDPTEEDGQFPFALLPVWSAVD